MGNRRALLIGSTSFADPRLPALRSPIADVGQFAAVLGDPEVGAFDVSSVTDQEVQAVRVAIARLLMDSRRDDVNVIYYSGHGILDAYGRHFLAFRDTRTEILSATGLSSQFILDEIGFCRAKSKVLILDCSYAGAALRGGTIPDDVLLLASSGVTEHSSFQEAVTDAGQTADLSRFSAGLIQGLRSGDADLDGDGTVTFNELFLYARRAVESSANGEQTPRLYDLTEKPIVAGRAARSIFLSYSRADTGFASPLADELRRGGHKVWVDTAGIGGGDDWQERIGTAIESSKLVVTVLSREAFESTWVRRELSYADRAGKPILPIFREVCELPGWYELRFGDIQRFDLTGQTPADYREPLLSSVQRILQSRSSSAGWK